MLADLELAGILIGVLVLIAIVSVLIGWIATRKW